ncbi:MAG: FHA domain-containing serine/threonine-protein kinase [Acidobacteriota bacterium]
MSIPEVPGYEVQDRLGAGGMGEVYRARCRPDGRVVAIKIEGSKSSDPRAHFRERFLREARILRDLRHENLPQFFGVGQVPDGRVFIAMELLVGRPLAEFAGQDLETLVPLFLQCARALKVTSAAGVVHRDVSPDNFFVVEVGGRSVVKLIDFGISRDAAAIADGLTRAGTFLGKLKYCSPEQTGLLRSSAPVDWRTDLYSFGLTIYAVVLGRLPFAGATSQQQFQGRARELKSAVFEDLSSERLRKLLPRMLAREPESRPGSFDEVVAELLRVKADLAEEQASRFDASARLQARNVEARSAPPAAAAVGRPEAVVPSLPRETPRRRSGFETLASTRGLVLVSLLLVVGGLLLLGMGAGAKLLPPVFVLLGAVIAALAVMRSRAGRSQKSPVDLARGPSAAQAPDGPRGAHLVVSGDGPTRDVWLCGDHEGSWPVEIVIGRGVPEGPAAVRVASRAVSGLQARLRHQGGTFSIENLSRTNTTRVNGRELSADEKKLLAVGDRIEMGPVTISFHVR